LSGGGLRPNQHIDPLEEVPDRHLGNRPPAEGADQIVSGGLGGGGGVEAGILLDERREKGERSRDPPVVLAQDNGSGGGGWVSATGSDGESESDGEGFGDWIGLDQIRCDAKQREGPRETARWERINIRRIRVTHTLYVYGRIRVSTTLARRLGQFAWAYLQYLAHSERGTEKRGEIF